MQHEAVSGGIVRGVHRQRNSPVLRQLSKAGLQLDVFDPNFNISAPSECPLGV